MKGGSRVAVDGCIRARDLDGKGETTERSGLRHATAELSGRSIELHGDSSAPTLSSARGRDHEIANIFMSHVEIESSSLFAELQFAAHSRCLRARVLRHGPDRVETVDELEPRERAALERFCSRFERERDAQPANGASAIPRTPGLMASKQPAERLFGELRVVERRAHGRDVQRVEVRAAEHHARAARDGQLDDAFHLACWVVAHDAAEHRLRAPHEAFGVDGEAVGEALGVHGRERTTVGDVAGHGVEVVRVNHVREALAKIHGLVVGRPTNAVRTADFLGHFDGFSVRANAV